MSESPTANPLHNAEQFLKSSTAIPYDSAMTTDENAVQFVKRRRVRRLRRGEPRKSARGSITRFATRGRWLRVEEHYGKLFALHATKGWRRVPGALADYLKLKARVEA